MSCCSSCRSNSAMRSVSLKSLARMNAQVAADPVGARGVDVDPQLALARLVDDGPLDLGRKQPPDRRDEAGLERDLHAHRAPLDVGVELRPDLVRAADARREQGLEV